jgi:hypothetical protein
MNKPTILERLENRFYMGDDPIPDTIRYIEELEEKLSKFKTIGGSWYMPGVWYKTSERLPDPGDQVLLITENRLWCTPVGVDEAHVTATGYLAHNGPDLYWAIFGERGMELESFTHWMGLPELPDA